MLYLKIPPSPTISQFIECYWMIDSEGDTTINIEKIVPDGFPETILHYADPYEINMTGDWQMQDKMLLAGQLTNHFFLRNTGASGMIGIKWKADALNHLFGLNMELLVDAVVSLPPTLTQLFAPLMHLQPGGASEEILLALDEFLVLLLEGASSNSPVSKAVATIHASKGKTEIEALAEQVHMSPRTLERHFRKSVGLSPKFYSRIIRLNQVFEMVQSGHPDWADVVYQSGFYDQAHFIKNFKEFIGEDPSGYGFDASNMANFHLRK